MGLTFTINVGSGTLIHCAQRDLMSSGDRILLAHPRAILSGTICFIFIGAGDANFRDDGQRRRRKKVIQNRPT